MAESGIGWIVLMINDKWTKKLKTEKSVEFEQLEEQEIWKFISFGFF